VEVANIDALQGRECDVVVLSCVRSNSIGQLGHVDELRRLNVALTRAKRALVVIGDKDTLKQGYESGISSFIRNVYQRGLVIEVPRDNRPAADFLSGDPKDVVMHPTEASATAKALSSHQPDVSRITERRKKIILATASGWIPSAHCGAPPSFEQIITHADELLVRMPWLVALAYSLDLPYKKYNTTNLPESALEWDMKALSRQNFFTRIGVALDPSNVVLSCVLLVCICRSGACVHGVHEGLMGEPCAARHAKKSKLTEILRNCGKASKMAQARLLLLRMQSRFASLRFLPGRLKAYSQTRIKRNFEKAGDVVESTGGILSPWRVSAGVVGRYLANLFGLSRDDVLETVEAMGALARQCKDFYAHICRINLNEDAQLPYAFAEIIKGASPAIQPCTGMVCPLCESLAALSAEAVLATCPTALASLPAAPATGLAPSVMGPTLASSSAAPATSLAAPPATGSQRQRRWGQASLDHSAPPPLVTVPAAPPATGCAAPPRPMVIIDSRFEDGAFCCDKCWWWCRGNTVGTFWNTRGMRAAEYRRSAWDASW